MSTRTVRLLIAAAAGGFALLALEVIWFRFLILFNFATSLAFAVMLAVVLVGIAAGALVASMLLRTHPEADRFAAVIALAAGVVVILSYWGFSPSLSWKNDVRVATTSLMVDSVRLMLPVSLFSGFFFTALGKALVREIGDDTRSAALLTCWNTIGAAVGSALAGFVLVPWLGVERSFVAIALVYFVAGVLTLPVESRAFRSAIAAAAVLVLAIVFFPFGLFRATFVPTAVRANLSPTTSIVAVREGLLETAVLLRTEVAGEPYAYRLFTNGYSMSGTTFEAKRYMSLFVHLPVALRPAARSALLISYGVGVTAGTLVEQPQLASIDVVDPSLNILRLSPVIHPGRSNPLADPRVRVHIEDGRFFLLTTERRFDLITAEPPPPKSAGIVSLYTLEYFRLLRDRLTPEGIATYWLPVYQLDAAEAKAITAAFCGAFPDCSLWSGSGAEWILVGSRGGAGTVNERDFARQWREPAAGTRLRWLGFEHPGQLASTFLADADGLKALTRGAQPLTDNNPLRLSPTIVWRFATEFTDLMGNAPRAFSNSRFVARLLPPGVRREAMQFYREQQLADDTLHRHDVTDPRTLDAILEKTDLRILPRMLMGTDMWLESIALRARARGDRLPSNSAILGMGALADRDYARAEHLLGDAADGGIARVAPYAILSAYLAGDAANAKGRLDALPNSSPWKDPSVWSQVSK